MRPGWCSKAATGAVIIHTTDACLRPGCSAPPPCSGQVRKTRQPYVTHCIETALIVEGLLSPTEEDQRWVGGRRRWRLVAARSLLGGGWLEGGVQRCTACLSALRCPTALLC